MFVYVLLSLLACPTSAWVCLTPKKQKAAPKGEESPAKKQKAAHKGEGMDRGKVSAMITALKYTAEQGKHANKKQAAMEALENYRSRSPNEKAEFLAAFEKHGGVKGGLGWVASFQKSGEQCNSSQFSENANYHTRASILTLNGMGIRDFESQREALAVADQIIEMNRQEHPALHEVNPQKIF